MFLTNKKNLMSDFYRDLRHLGVSDNFTPYVVNGTSIRHDETGAILVPAVHQDIRRQVIENGTRSEEHTSELQSLMRISYAVFCLKKTKKEKIRHTQQLDKLIKEKTST